MKKRVVVTGLGAVTPLGNSVSEMWEHIKKGISGVGLLTKRDASLFPVKVASEVKEFNPSSLIEEKELRRMDLFVQYALYSSLMALQDSKLSISDENSHRVGVWIGSGIGGMSTFEEQHRTFLERGARRVSPFFVPMMIPDMAAGQVSIFLGAKGVNSCTVTACASGSNAIGDAFKVIQRGDADVMITGGTEAPITDMALAGFSSAKALSFNNDPNTASRPFDKNRDGFVIGEGAGILILEDLEHAIKRGAPIYAEIIGYGATGDAYHITSPAPNGEGGSRAMTMALEDANVLPSEVQYINAHGTSTPLNDKFETQAIKTSFGEHAYNVSISSTKSMTGHLLGAAGGVEAIITIKSIQENVIPPTIHYEVSDEECDLNYTPNQLVEKNVDVAISNSLGFGGHNATLVFRKYKG